MHFAIAVQPDDSQMHWTHSPIKYGLDSHGWDPSDTILMTVKYNGNAVVVQKLPANLSEDGSGYFYLTVNQFLKSIITRPVSTGVDKYSYAIGSSGIGLETTFDRYSGGSVADTEVSDKVVVVRGVAPGFTGSGYLTAHSGDIPLPYDTLTWLTFLNSAYDLNDKTLRIYAYYADGTDALVYTDNTFYDAAENGRRIDIKIDPQAAYMDPSDKGLVSIRVNVLNSTLEVEYDKWYRIDNSELKRQTFYYLNAHGGIEHVTMGGQWAKLPGSTGKEAYLNSSDTTVNYGQRAQVAWDGSTQYLTLSQRRALVDAQTTEYAWFMLDDEQIPVTLEIPELLLDDSTDTPKAVRFSCKVNRYFDQFPRQIL